MISRFTKFISVLLLSQWGVAAYGDWQLDSSQSHLFFVTTKAGNVAEINKFDRLSGSITGQGTATLVIDLSSVNTNIQIRDERLQEHLFNTQKYPTATLTTEVDRKMLDQLAVGTPQALDLTGSLDLHGKTVTISTSAIVIKQQNGSLRINNKVPIIVKGEDFGLVSGIEKLREIAGLPAISTSVTTTFELVYKEK